MYSPILLAIVAISHITIAVPVNNHGTHYAPSLRIIGGQEATPHERPEVVFLRLRKGANTGVCGGSLLSTRYVLTAAHCVGEVDEIEVVLGVHNRSNPETGSRTIKAKRWEAHEYYDDENDDNDIAIVELDTPVTFTPHIQPVTLPPSSDEGEKYEGRSSKIYGWGQTADVGKASDVLKVVSAPIVSYEACKNNLARAGFKLPKHDICTQATTTRGTCEGDSGSPLFIEERKPVKKTIQVGIVSTGFECGANVPNIFVQVADYLGWIVKHSDVKAS